jgi:hypothetical protein
MKNPILISRPFLILWLIALMACRGTLFPATQKSSSTMDAPSIVTAVLPTQLPAATPESTSQPVAHLRPVAGQSGPGAVMVSNGEPPTFLLLKGTLPNQQGDYVIYRTWTGSIGYIAADGSIGGDLLSNKNPMASLRDFLLTSNLSAPRLVFVSGAIPDRYLSITDLTGRPLKNWHVRDGFSSYCGSPFFSPGGHWMAIFCYEGKVYLNLIDLESGEKKVIPTPCSGEFSPVPSGTTWAEMKWSEDEKQFSFWCSIHYYYCFLSTSEGEGICKDIKRSLWSVSPDWSKAVLELGEILNTTDGARTGIRALIADMNCVLEGPNCTHGVAVDFPYRQKTSNTLYSSVDILWSKSGQSFTWMNTAYPADGTTKVVEDTSCGWVDLESNTSMQLCQNAAEGTKLVGISPDERWLLFQDQRSLYLMSISDHTIYPLVDAQDDTLFYGWLVVP